MSVAYDYQPRTEWTPEIENHLHTLVKEGVSREIAALRIWREWGIKFTRNAVVGKAHRMGWSVPRSEVRQPRGENRKPRFDRGIRRAPYLRLVEPPQPWAGSLDIPFLELGPNQCREIVGVGVALCCGQPQTVASSYCAHHHAINHWVRR
jgi:hypothetical protein